MLIKRSERRITDEMIIKAAVDAYSLGFEGFIGWSFYNEPCMSYSRILDLMVKIKTLVPQSRFILWTNGTILVEDERSKLFDQVYVTNYNNISPDKFVKAFGPEVLYKCNPQLDERIDRISKEPNLERCGLPFDNFLIANDGEVFACCHDWQNDIKIGNLFNSSLEELDKKRWEHALRVSGKQMTAEAPYSCKACKFKWKEEGWDKALLEKAQQKIKEI